MLMYDEVEARRAQIEDAPDLAALRDRLVAAAAGVAERGPALPPGKGMLSADGGVCPTDRRPLVFDPWSPEAHRCPGCGMVHRGPRHDRRWAWLAHLWRAERIATAACAGALAEDAELLGWAAGAVTEYAARYHDYPNRDNVLGPSRLFFSTYLESVWLTNYVAAAFLLREQGALEDAALVAVNATIEESANLIGEFDERLSNRQTWHNAALAAAGVWFEDEDLVQRAIEGPRGLVGHLVDGFGADGMWYEGENYHLFALRGLLVGADWARLAGVDLFEPEAGRARLAAALRAPLLSALPDLRVPARKDSRFGLSLAQPMYLELWERGLGRLHDAGAGNAAVELAGGLRALYALPAPPAETFDSYLHEAGEPAPATRTRASLSWWMLATMAPDLPDGPAWQPGSTLLPEQGLAVLRGAGRYASVECGEYGGGHGHPDRLHLTLHAGGVHWLADPGTGSYVDPVLHWYRSTLAHNAPRVDGADQPMESARAEMFEQRGPWGWVRGRFGGLTRTVVAGPAHLVDVVEFADEQEHLVELPWHVDGTVELLSPGAWEPATLEEPWVSGAERLRPAAAGPIQWRAATGGGRLEGCFEGGGELLRAQVPGRPGESGGRSMLLLRRTGRYVRFVTVLAWEGPSLTGMRVAPSEIVVETADGETIHQQTSEGWEVRDGAGTHPLRGLRRALPRIELTAAVRDSARDVPPAAVAYHLPEPPALDGTLAGFVGQSPLHLDHDDQYRRTEEPYPGPEALAARAWLGWDERELFVAVEVTHPHPVFRAAGAPPLLLDNEPDLIHADGIQVYLQPPQGAVHGWLVAPDPGGAGLGVRVVQGLAGEAAGVRGAWRRTATGYCLTLALAAAGWPPGANAGPAGFDLLVNAMAPGRERRQGQLVWSGGGGWAYLRGDRQDPARFGTLELA